MQIFITVTLFLADSQLGRINADMIMQASDRVEFTSSANLYQELKEQGMKPSRAFELVVQAPEIRVMNPEKQVRMGGIISRSEYQDIIQRYNGNSLFVNLSLVTLTTVKLQKEEQDWRLIQLGAFILLTALSFWALILELRKKNQ